MGRREKRVSASEELRKGRRRRRNRYILKRRGRASRTFHPIEDVTTVLLQRWRGNGRGGIWLQNSALHRREALDLLSLVSAGMTPRSSCSGGGSAGDGLRRASLPAWMHQYLMKGRGGSSIQIPLLPSFFLLHRSESASESRLFLGTGRKGRWEDAWAREERKRGQRRNRNGGFGFQRRGKGREP